MLGAAMGGLEINVYWRVYLSSIYPHIGHGVDVVIGTYTFTTRNRCKCCYFFLGRCNGANDEVAILAAS